MALTDSRFLEIGGIFLLSIFLTLASPTANAGPLIQRSTIEIPALQQAFFITPYVDSNGEWLYLQPQGNGEEQIFSVRDGSQASNPSSIIRGSQRLGSLSPTDVLAATQNPRYNYLYRLGCSRHNRGCTVLDDSSHLIFTSYEKNIAKIVVETVNIGPLLDYFAMLISGEIKASSAVFDDTDRSVLDYAMRFTSYREKLIDGIHSINTLDRLGNFQDTRRTLDLCNWAAFTCADNAKAAIDLRREEEQRLVRIYAIELSKKFLAQSGKSQPLALVDFLMKISAPPFPAGDASAYAIDELSKLSTADRERISRGLLSAAPGNGTIYCFSAWLNDRKCAIATENAPRTEQQPQVSPTFPRERLTSSTPLSNGIPEEWQKINAVQDKMQLLSIDESSGKLIRDKKTIGGVVFVARAIGNITDGQFEIQAKASGNTPIPFRFGSYRVKLELALNFVREDTCVGILRCLIENNERISKVENRTLVFTLQPTNSWSDTKTVSFGYLLPLTAEGSGRYKSELKDFRLAAKGINWSLN